MPSFPNVPAAPGVPTLLRNPTATVNSITLLVADILSLFSLTPVWGVFDVNGNQVLQPDTIVGVEFKQDNQISDYPQEAGGFASYNKVATPFSMKVRMVKGGTDSERGAFLVAVDTICADLNLYSVVMPDGTYPSVNMDHYDFERRHSHGVGLLTVDCWFTEVRITGSTTFSSTAQPSGQDLVNAGTVVPRAPIPAVTVTPL